MTMQTGDRNLNSSVSPVDAWDLSPTAERLRNPGKTLPGLKDRRSRS